MVIIGVVFLAGACNREAHNPSQTKTETIAPAQAQPAPTGTEALTQTTEIEDSRSEGEGGTSETAAPPATKKTAKTAPVPAKTTKKHK